ncbi:MAG TPA: hypothetical protein VET24_12875 [Actinomycetota bacterium]|nr:hypothetical protein [Actinomycetota bacterium]
MADETEQEIPLAWTAMPYRAPVLDRNGKRVGTAESLEGDEARDIFHGIIVKLEGSRELRELLADRITKITSKAVYTDLDDAELESLPPFKEEPVYRLDWGGLFRKHPQWKDEGPPRRIGG